MPVYEYTCKRCETRFEVLVRSMTTPEPGCPNCGASSVNREFSTFATVGSTKSSGGGCAGCAGGGCACGH